MSHPPSRVRRWVPPLLGSILLALVGAAVVLPNSSAFAAQTTCQYGVCQTTGGTLDPTARVVLGVIVVVAIALVALLFLRRRRGGAPPEAEGASGPSAAALGYPAGSAAAEGAPEGPAFPEAAPGLEEAAPYVESPHDVGVPPPAAEPGSSVPPALGTEEAEAAEAAAAGMAVPDDEGDIDKLMAELDRISGEIASKKAALGGRKPPAPPPPEYEEGQPPA
jgi:hypothetical protein